MEKRALFPMLMFSLAGVSFIFGGWQYFHASSVQASAQERLAYIITTIEESPVGHMQKQQLYSSIMSGLPKAPDTFSLDVSGSFASPSDGDSCTNDGQRAVCNALIAEGTDTAVYTAVCGVCNPKK